jgi:hypothetical protein
MSLVKVKEAEMATAVGLRSSKLDPSIGDDQRCRESLNARSLQSVDSTQKNAGHASVLDDNRGSGTSVDSGRPLHKLSEGLSEVPGGMKANMQNSSPADSSTTQLLTESSTMSLQEMFDDEDLIPQNPGISISTEPMDRSNFTPPINEDDQWFNGDGGLLDRDDQPSFTPPLSLYAGTKYVLPATVPESSYPSSLASSGMNTPVSQATGILSNGDNQSCSVSSNTTSSVSRSNRPILYSAIGSLETFNASSFGDFSKRVGPRRDFSKLGAPQSTVPSALLPRMAIGEDSTHTDVSTPLLASDKHGLLSQEQQNKTSVRSTGSARATPTASNRKQQTDVEDVSHPHTVDSTGKAKGTKVSNLKKSKDSIKNGHSKKVSIKKDTAPKKPVEMFRPSCDAYTPRIEKKRIEYRKAEMRTPVQKMASPMGTLSRPNFRDALRRVAMIIHKHIVKIEGRFERYEKGADDHGLFKQSMREIFSEDNYCTPTYRCTMVRIPMARPGMVYGLRKIKIKPTIPSEEEIYEFAHQLFKSVQLSSECSIVCLIYVERLMEAAKVPLLANTWRPIFMCGLLLASKVWQDLSSWNIEFASVYPQYSLEAVNRLELNFLRNVKWDLYISTSLYAKYYFALRSLVEKVDFRQRYNRMVGGVDSVAQSEALKISKRTEQFKEETILQLSRSM